MKKFFAAVCMCAVSAVAPVSAEALSSPGISGVNLLPVNIDRSVTLNNLILPAVEMAASMQEVRQALGAPSASLSLVTQSGSDHLLQVEQYGRGNIGLIVQEGRGNAAFLTQTGQNNIGLISQIGSMNSVNLTQIGGNHSAAVLQQGYGNVAIIRQR